MVALLVHVRSNGDQEGSMDPVVPVDPVVPQTTHLKFCFKNSSEPDLQRHHLQFQQKSMKDAGVHLLWKSGPKI